jgi:hypothetical protein
MKLGMIDKSFKITKTNSRLSQYIKPSLTHKVEKTNVRKRLTEKLPYFYSQKFSVKIVPETNE